MAEANIEEEGAPSDKFKPSYVVIALDTHKSMFEAEGQPTPFKNCLNALYRLADALLLKADKRGWCPFSVQLYKKHEETTLVDFKTNMIETTKLLKEKCRLSEEDLKNEFMRNGNLDLAAFFQSCKKKFKDISSHFYSRILIFITNDSNPIHGDASKRFTALHEAKNFRENDISFELIVCHEDFQYEQFYTELFSQLDCQSHEIICEDEEGLFEKLIQTICYKLSQRKILFYPFADDRSKYMSVVSKSYLKSSKLLNNSFVASDGTFLKRITKNTTAEGSGSTLFKYHLRNQQTKSYFDKIDFDIQEKMLLENFKPFPVGYTLLYVCDRISGVGDVISEPRILEEDSREEVQFFKHFWRYSRSKNKILVCVKVAREGDSPEAVELIPKLMNRNKVFLEKKIAFADEIFEPEKNNEDAAITLTAEGKQVMDNIIKRLTCDFESCFIIDAPTLKKINYVKSKLLDEERRDIEVRDRLNIAEIDEKIEDLLNPFFNCFPPQVVKGVKRKRK